MHAVYVLKDESGNPRYVGVTTEPAKRLARHLREAKERRTHRHRWVMSMVDRGVAPTLEVVEQTENWDEAERRWIAKLRSDGASLVNGNDGGHEPSHFRSGVSERSPNLKRAYRRLEAFARGVSPELQAKLAYAKERLHLAADTARKNGTLGQLDARLARLIHE
jgi:predicted GIY-YIG superfamily endonuclease